MNHQTWEPYQMLVGFELAKRPFTSRLYTNLSGICCVWTGVTRDRETRGKPCAQSITHQHLICASRMAPINKINNKKKAEIVKKCLKSEIGAIPDVLANLQIECSSLPKIKNIYI
jgi:hypothetical protein